MEKSVECDIDYKINRIVNRVTKQAHIRLNEIGRYPLCVLYGKFPEEVEMSIAAEIVAKLGTEEAVEIVKAASEGSIIPELGAVLNKYRKNMEKGNLRLLDEYYIPVIFMADQIQAEQMVPCVESLHTELSNQGYAEKYTICYYGIINYTSMDGNFYKTQMEELRKIKACDHPLGTFTHFNYYESEHSKYIRAVRAIAMHVFLQISKKDAEDIPRNFTLGYWKMDVLKQKITDFLIQYIERQQCKLIGDEDYEDRLQKIVEKIVVMDRDKWISRFRAMPINFTNCDQIIHPNILQWMQGSVRYSELLELMYGDQEMFSCFLNQNADLGDKNSWMESFFREDIGNLYAVENNLEKTLRKLKKQYLSEVGKLDENRKADPLIKRNRKTTIESVLQECAALWNVDADAHLFRRRIAFIDCILEHIDSKEFKRKMQAVKDDNRNQLSSLASIRREASMTEEYLLKTADIDIIIEGEKLLPVWNLSVQDENFLETVQGWSTDIKNQVQSWMYEKRIDIVGDFLHKLQNLKSTHKQELYYAARMDKAFYSEEKEYLYMNLDGQRQRLDAQGLDRVVNSCLPETKVREREWETDMCFELVALMEVPDLNVFYGID